MGHDANQVLLGCFSRSEIQSKLHHSIELNGKGVTGMWQYQQSKRYPMVKACITSVTFYVISLNNDFVYWDANAGKLENKWYRKISCHCWRGGSTLISVCFGVSLYTEHDAAFVVGSIWADADLRQIFCPLSLNWLLVGSNSGGSLSTYPVNMRYWDCAGQQWPASTHHRSDIVGLLGDACYINAVFTLFG